MAQPGSEFRRGAVSAFGYDIPYAEAGTGPTIISLPGSAGLEMSTAKDVLAAEFRVIELDPPGWGSTPSVAAEMKQRHLATILGAALDEIGVDRFILIGTSMGGLNALWLARQMPDRVMAMVLEGPMAFCRQEDFVNPAAGGMVDAIRSGLLPAYDSSYPPPPPHPSKPWATAEVFHEQMRRRFKMMKFSDYPGQSDQLEQFVRTTSIPATMVLGTDDEILKTSYSEHLRSLMPTLKVVIVDGATHDVQNTASDAFVDAVRSVAIEP